MIVISIIPCEMINVSHGTYRNFHYLLSGAIPLDVAHEDDLKKLISVTVQHIDGGNSLECRINLHILKTI